MLLVPSPDVTYADCRAILTLFVPAPRLARAKKFSALGGEGGGEEGEGEEEEEEGEGGGEGGGGEGKERDKVSCDDDDDDDTFL